MPETPYMELYPAVPTMPEPRETQKILMQKTFEIMDQNPEQRKFVICAPTGSGKTLYGVWVIEAIAAYIRAKEEERMAGCSGGEKEERLARLNTRGVYTSPLNVLVDQFDESMKEYERTATLKGREHYQCKAGKENCAVGYCQLNQCSLSPSNRRYVVVETTVPVFEYRDVIKEDGTLDKERVQIGTKTNREKKSVCGTCDIEECMCRICTYKNARAAFFSAPVGNTNFSLFEIIGTSNTMSIVVDEMDDVEDFLRMQHAVTVPRIIRFGDLMDQSPYFSQHIECLRDIKMEIDCDIELADNGKVPMSGAEYLAASKHSNRIGSLLDDWDAHKLLWCVSYDEDRHTTKYEPITITRFLNQMFEPYHYVIMMSATPVKMDGYAFIEVPSTFPAVNRPWKYLPLGKMGKNHREANSELLAQFLITLRGKTLVHCHAYSIAKLLAQKIHAIDPTRVVFLQHRGKTNKLSETNSYGRGEIVDRFKQSTNPDAILLSVNLARGVDFPEPDIINNVIAKIPWKDYRDPLVQAKNYVLKGRGWQDEEIARTLMQAYGRLPRSPQKYSRCIITDVDFNDPKGYAMLRNWYEKNKKHFYTWFTEAEVERFIK